MATPERWLSVSEAGRALGLSRTSLLAAEEAGLLASLRTPGGHRRYRPADEGSVPGITWWAVSRSSRNGPYVPIG